MQGREGFKENSTSQYLRAYNFLANSWKGFGDTVAVGRICLVGVGNVQRRFRTTRWITSPSCVTTVPLFALRVMSYPLSSILCMDTRVFFMALWDRAWGRVIEMARPAELTVVNRAVPDFASVDGSMPPPLR